MSIKIRTSLIFSIIVTAILITHNALNYIATKDLLRAGLESQVELVAKEVTIAIEHSRYGSRFVEGMIGDQLHMAAIAAKKSLPPRADQVTNEQLTQLSKELHISGITLFQPVGDDIVGVKSSDPNELQLGTKEWGYWYTALQQLWSEQNVTITEGQSLPNYWSGPIEVASSDPSRMDKWGYYYDGTTDYILNPFVHVKELRNYEFLTGPESIVNKTLQDHEIFLEITGFNPRTFGKAPSLTTANGNSYVEMQNRPVLFGNYTYRNEPVDTASIEKALATGKAVNVETFSNGKHVIKSFIPASSRFQPYVIGIVTDYQFLQDTLDKQFSRNIMISLLVVLFVFVISYFLASYIVKPAYHLLAKVNEIATGNFSVRVGLKRKDEWGLLADRIDAMTLSLEAYTNELERKNEQIQFQAFHDPLTKLPNRLLFHDYVNEAIESAIRDGSSGAVMFIDLDRLKLINDTLGHNTGDQLLLAAAERITAYLREGDVLSRLSGDEFTLLLRRIDGADEACGLANRILQCLTKPFVVNEQELFITASIGISLFPTDGRDAETLIINADMAMYVVKKQGGNNWQQFHPEMNMKNAERIALGNHLRKALEVGEFELYYQPKMDIVSGQMTGMESLIRWNSQQFGMVSPAKFIPLAEETGLIVPIGEWVLRTACAQNKAWQEAGYPPMRVAVNLSARQFHYDDLVETVNRILQDTQLAPEWLELEITESILMQDTNGTVETLRQLKAMGIHISVDDFGTGYSSLSYLKHFPIDSLKIDRSFLNDGATASTDDEIIKAIITLGHSLRLKVIAEGVETEEQLSFLRDRQCDQIQGYFFSRPLPGTQFELMLQQEAANRMGTPATLREGAGHRQW